MYVYQCLCTRWLWTPEKGVRDLGTVDTGGYELPDMGTRHKLGSFERAVCNHWASSLALRPYTQTHILILSLSLSPLENSNA